VSSDFVLDPDSTNNTLVQYRNGDVAVIDQADVSLTGTVSNANPVAGDTVTLTVDLNNLGPNVASGLQVRIDVSDGIEIVSGSPGVQGTFDAATGIWDVGNMRDELTRSLTVTILVNDPQDAYAAAQVIALSEPDPDSEPDNGYVGEDDEFVFFGTPP